MSVVLDTWSGTILFLLWCIMFAILITDVWLPCKTSQIYAFYLNRDGLIDIK